MKIDKKIGKSIQGAKRKIYKRISVSNTRLRQKNASS